MAADTTGDSRAHQETYDAFSKLVLFAILWIVLILACMALGLLGGLSVLSLLLGVGGTIALIVGFAVMG